MKRVIGIAILSALVAGALTAQLFIFRRTTKTWLGAFGALGSALVLGGLLVALIVMAGSWIEG